MENNYKEYMGYKVYEDGTIISPKGKTLKKGKQVLVKLSDHGLVSVTYLKFIYFVYHQDTFKLFGDKVVKSKDDTTNISSLYEERRGKRFEKSKLDQATVEKIKIEYETKNRGIAPSNPHKRISYRRLAQKYSVSHVTIQKIMNGTYEVK